MVAGNPDAGGGVRWKARLRLSSALFRTASLSTQVVQSDSDIHSAPSSMAQRAMGHPPAPDLLPNQALWRRHSDAVNLRLLRDWLGGQQLGRVLKTDLFDEAVCTGLLPFLRGRARMTTWIDISYSISRAVKAQYPAAELVVTDVSHLPFPDNAFHCIVSNSTLDHLQSQEEIRRAIAGLAGKLKRGGTLILTMDNLSNPVVWIRNALPFGWLHRLRLVPYSIGATCGPGRLLRYVRQSGLEVRDVRGILHCPRALAVGAAGLLDRRTGPQLHDRFLRFLMGFEVMARWPTRFVTAYFVAVLADKP